MEKMAKNAEKCYFGKCKDSLERVLCTIITLYVCCKMPSSQLTLFSVIFVITDWNANILGSWLLKLGPIYNDLQRPDAEAVSHSLGNCLT